MTARKPYANPWERLASYLMDVVILFFLSAFVSAFFAESGPDGKPIVAPIAILFVFLLNMAYYTGFAAGKWQATPGERLMNLYLIRTDGKKLSQRDALERFLLLIAPSLPLYASFLPQTIAPMLVIWLHVLWFSPILTHAERAGIHDKITHTRVVQGKPKP